MYLKKQTMLKSHIIFILIVFSVSVISCKKIKLDKLEDTWKLTKVSETEYADVFEIWDFKNGTLTRMVKNDTISLLDTLDVCQYELILYQGPTHVQLKGCSEIIHNGDWKVVKLRSSVMVLLSRRDHEFLYREFEK